MTVKLSTILTQNQELNRVQAQIQDAFNRLGESSGSTSSSGSLPPGACSMFFGPTYIDDPNGGSGQVLNDPPGWLICINGRSVKKSDYPELYAAIGPAVGDDGVENFWLPQVDGLFPRFTDHGAAVDPNAGTRTATKTGANTGDKVGSLQADEFKSHTHTFVSGVPTDGGGSNAYENASASQYSHTTAARGGSETRPKNIYFNLIVKT